MADADQNLQVFEGAEASLGTTAKFRAASGSKTAERRGFIDPDTGEIHSGAEYDAAGVRVERFALQSVVRDLLPDSRTASCLRRRQKGKDVEVWRSIEHGVGSFGGLQTCSSVWACPVCAAKISERRRAELLTAITLWQAQGGAVVLLTLTHAHHSSDGLSEQLDGQTKALHSLMRNRPGRRLFASMGCIGHVRAWEVTHGANGWHPHFHILVFVRVGLDLLKLQADFASLWQSCCVRAGLAAPSLERGARLDDGSKAAKYASKWGLESELTKGHIKKAKGGSTPFDLLRRVLVDSTDKRSGVLFREFAKCFHGLQQLHWSRGLKARFLVSEVEDSELASRLDDHSHLLGKILPDDWRHVLRFEGRAIVLELARSGWEAIELYLSGLRARATA